MAPEPRHAHPLQVGRARPRCRLWGSPTSLKPAAGAPLLKQRAPGVGRAWGQQRSAATGLERVENEGRFRGQKRATHPALPIYVVGWRWRVSERSGALSLHGARCTDAVGSGRAAPPALCTLARVSACTVNAFTAIRSSSPRPPHSNPPPQPSQTPPPYQPLPGATTCSHCFEFVVPHLHAHLQQLRPSKAHKTRRARQEGGSVVDPAASEQVRVAAGRRFQWECLQPMPGWRRNVRLARIRSRQTDSAGACRGGSSGPLCPLQPAAHA
jgi:hypothetical protein